MKTRIRNLEDGRQEVIRLLSPDEMDNWTKEDPLSYEKSIVWLQDIERLPFVRVKTVRAARSRRGPIYLGGDVLVVGYAKLTPNAPRSSTSSGYVRRVFYLHVDDVKKNVAQVSSSVLDPTTILPGIAGTPVESV